MERGFQKYLERHRSQERRQGSSIKRTLSWKSYKNLQKLEEGLRILEPAGGRFAGFEPRRNSRTTQNGNSPWRSYMTIGGTPTVIKMIQNS